MNIKILFTNGKEVVIPCKGYSIVDTLDGGFTKLPEPMIRIRDDGNVAYCKLSNICYFAILKDNVM